MESTPISTSWNKWWRCLCSSQFSTFQSWPFTLVMHNNSYLNNLVLVCHTVLVVYLWVTLVVPRSNANRTSSCSKQLLFNAQLVQLKQKEICNLVSFQIKLITKFIVSQNHLINLFLQILVTLLLPVKHGVPPILTITAQKALIMKNYRINLMRRVKIRLNAPFHFLMKISTRKITWKLTNYSMTLLLQPSTKDHVVTQPVSMSNIHAWSQKNRKIQDNSTVFSSVASLFSFISSC